MSGTLRAGLIGLGDNGSQPYASPAVVSPMSSWSPRWIHSTDLIMLR